MNDYTEEMVTDIADILEESDGEDYEVLARRVLEGLTLPYVVITSGTVAAFGSGWHAADEAGTNVPGARRRAGLRAALESLGFRVRSDA